jgi:hypothetical protein
MNRQSERTSITAAGLLLRLPFLPLALLVGLARQLWAMGRQAAARTHPARRRYRPRPTRANDRAAMPPP